MNGMTKSRPLAIATTLLAMAGTFAAVGASAPASAADPVAAPTITSLTTGTHSNGPAIKVGFTACAGCDLVVSWSTGSKSAFPTTYPTKDDNDDDLGSTSPTSQVFTVDRTEYHLSFFAQAADKTLSAPVHKSVYVPEWLSGLAPAVGLMAAGTHSAVLDYEPDVGDTAQRYRTRVYVAAGKTPPGTSHTLPKTKPVIDCVIHHCSKNKDVDPEAIIRNLKDVGYVSFSAYGSDRHGHRRRYAETDYIGHNGVHISGAGIVAGNIEDQASMAVDKHDVEHVITGEAVHAYTEDQHLNYLTGAAGTTRLASHRFHVENDDSGTVVSSGISTDGKYYWAAFGTCDEIDVSQTKIGATELAKRTEIAQGAGCDDGARPARAATGGPGTLDDPESLIGATALPHDELDVLGADYDGNTVVTTSSPGNKPVVTTLPGSAPTTVAEAITRDPISGDVVVAAQQVSSLDRGGVTTGFVVWTQQPGHAWSSPQTVAGALTDRPNAQVASVTDYRGAITVGIDGTIGQQFGKGVYTTHGTSGGTWSPVTEIAGSSAHAGYLLLATRPSGGRVFAAYDVTTGRGGIRTQRLGGAKASKPVSASDFNQDLPDSLVFTGKHHQPTVLYQREALGIDE